MQKATKVKTTILGNNNTVVNVNVTAMHIAHALYNNYCTALTNSSFKNEFAVNDSGDFAHYNVADMQDKLTAYFNAFAAVQQLVQQNINATVQQAFAAAHDGAAVVQYDTLIAEEIQESINSAIQCDSYTATINENIAADLADLALYS